MNRKYQFCWVFVIFVYLLTICIDHTLFPMSEKHIYREWKDEQKQQDVSYRQEYDLEDTMDGENVTRLSEADVYGNSYNVQDVNCPNVNYTVKPPLGAPKTAVLIYSSTRSGSTFLGEFFNQHPSVYYLFEPLRGINNSLYNSSQVSQSVLTDLFHCNYDRIPDIYKEYVDDKYSNCRRNVCFFTRSKFLWRNTELCKVKHPGCLWKKEFDTALLSKVCRQSLFTAMKVVRLTSLSDLVPILKDQSLSLKVIQLVRDPRLVVQSQMKMKNASANATASFAHDLCDKYFNDWLYFNHCINNGTIWDAADRNFSYTCDEDTRSLWKVNYMRLSHEYISESPKEAMKKIYDFVGLNIDSDVFSWLRSSTNARSYEKRAFFGTKRNSQKLLNEWRLKHNFSEVEEIQKQCRNMEHIGYIPAMSEKHLRNISQKLYLFDKALFTP